MTDSLQRAEAEIARLAPVFDAARQQIGRILVGQKGMVDTLLLGMLANGHVLLEGAPGLAKTTAVKAMSDSLALEFSRIQFTPDLLPADLVGTQIYEPKTGEFRTRLGPVIANVLLADEINRAPAKVQAALLESMQERQITLGDKTYALPRPFLVLATQNPIEQEGTYPLPEAQTDRFMFKVQVDYPSRDEELEIIQRSTSPMPTLEQVATADQILEAQKLIRGLKITEPLMAYIVDIVRATRTPGDYDAQLGRAVDYGASPRASIAIAAAARARAFLDGRAYCLPEDVKDVATEVLRHRVLPSYEAEADSITPDAIVKRILEVVKMQ
jgi:MoxR-like ATPase